ncbi:MAG: MBL fold metallo-hydrolase [Nitrospinota bacterium]|nr:MBL fold metallo-hydrolase [Nitrospinota bacterium]MDH5678159.1 MBL fold metallo-hydrolase [Nitrospinota bacterium]MDH5756538.1 MBL fold metallo-hydrolase [Nitrospinota bacterium]
MADILNLNLDYNKPIQVAEGVYWVGFVDPTSGLHCNPYLIIDGDEAALIDGGSRPDFATVMMKIMQTGVEPSSISTLIYHHYDPDLCGSIPNLENIIARQDLTVLSHRENNIFIRYYAARSRLRCVETMEFKFQFKSGRILRFFRTPYCHSAGSFITMDEKTGVLFTSDIFGSYDPPDRWKLFSDIPELCHSCDEDNRFDKDFKCKTVEDYCPLVGIFNFHRRIMTSNKALRHTLDIVEKSLPEMLAPQHGGILHKPGDISMVIDRLKTLNDVGIDGIAP